MSDHSHYMRLALREAEKSPPKPTNYRVGAVLVNARDNKILATGYTLELPGNTHAEQCCLRKFAESQGLPTGEAGQALPAEIQASLYTSMEPCVERLSGNMPCVDRILHTRNASGSEGIQTVYTGIKEPDTFVKQNSGRARLESNGVRVVHVGGFEDEALQIATAGHDKS